MLHRSESRFSIFMYYTVPVLCSSHVSSRINSLSIRFRPLHLKILPRTFSFLPVRSCNDISISNKFCSRSNVRRTSLNLWRVETNDREATLKKWSGSFEVILLIKCISYYTTNYYVVYDCKIFIFPCKKIIFNISSSF